MSNKKTYVGPTEKHRWAERIREIIEEKRSVVKPENKPITDEDVQAYLKKQGLTKEAQKVTQLFEQFNKAFTDLQRKTDFFTVDWIWSPENKRTFQLRTNTDIVKRYRDAESTQAKVLNSLAFYEKTFTDRLYLCNTTQQVAELMEEVGSLEVKVPASA